MSGARDAPRYTGVRTFAGLAQRALSELGGGAATGGAGPDAGARRAAVVGIPFDTATSWRPGARFGPEAIRSSSSLLRPWHPLHGIDVLAGVVDAGDVAVTPGNAARSADQIAAALAPACASGIVPVVLGGDHSVVLGELRAHAAAHGPLGMVLLDAHADTWDDYYGERIFHGTVVRRAIEEGLLDPSRSLIAGLRGSLYAPADLDDARALGLELIAIDELRALGADGFGQRVRARLQAGAGGAGGESDAGGQGGDGGRGSSAFLGFDIDVVDPAAAPGTGTPEVGGLSAAAALALVRALAGIRFAGFDVVEVSPPYDSPAQITALLAANVAYEMLALAALGGA